MDEVRRAEQSPAADQGGSARYYKRDFWSEENLKFSGPHFRLAKSARIINRLSKGTECDLLDVGCGPAALQRLLSPNIRYHGIDIAIQDPAPNLIEADLLEVPIGFSGKRFDIVVAQGFFEYVGSFQEQKLAELSELLTRDGRFLVSYVNFEHRDREIYWPYSNIQPIRQFRSSLSRHFRIDRSYPTSHNWRHSEPNRTFMRASQMSVSVSVPVLSRLLAVEYFFICSPRNSSLAA
jgi:SAM-dependent methyltransferase